MFTCTLDPHSRTTLCDQLYSALKAEIVRGGLRPGARMPSKRELAALYFPETVDPNVAVANLRYLFHRNPELWKALAEAHYHPRDRMLTPLQVRAIVEFLGEP